MDPSIKLFRLPRLVGFIPAVFLASPILLLIAIAAPDAQTETALVVNNLRVAKTDLKRSDTGTILQKRSTCVLMSLSSKTHYRLSGGQSFEPVKGEKLQVSHISEDGSVVLEDARKARVSVNPITDEEKVAYRKKFSPPSKRAEN